MKGLNFDSGFQKGKFSGQKCGKGRKIFTA
jgi:hypothetical protein